MTTVAPLSLAIDAGQTGMKVRVHGDRVTQQDRLFAGIRTHEPILPQLADVAREMTGGMTAPFETLSMGVSGLTGKDADAQSLRAILGDAAPRQIMLTHDSVTSFLGTLGDARGVVVASGTGVVTLAVGAHAVARVDGWGNIMGDAGSAYWIGREGLDAVMRAYDGRSAPTALHEVVIARWPQLEDAYVDLQSDPDRVRVVAEFAESVARMAETDSVCETICLRAAAELALSAAAALARVADPSDADDVAPLVSAIGGVFHSVLIRSRFEELLLESEPTAHFEPPHGSGLDGAAALTALGVDHPLRTLVSVHTSAD